MVYKLHRHFYESINGGEPTCIDDDIPFEIPDSWEWVRAGSIFEIWSAKRVHQSDWQNEGVPFFRTREIVKLAETGTVENDLFISSELFHKLSVGGLPHAGDLMITAVGTIGKVYIVRQEDRFYFKDASVISFRNYGGLEPYFLKSLISSSCVQNQIFSKSAGTTVDTITIVKANDYLLPIPPIEEQKRINKALTQREQQLIAILNSRKRYRRILSETPTSLRQQLIQAAIQGLLVPQNPHDEPARLLLERIAQERTAKLGKKAAKSMSRIVRRGSKTYIEISPEGKEKDISEEIPFDIPQNWEWCRLEQIGDAYIGLTYSPSDVREKGTAVLRANNIQNGKICYDEVLHVETDIPERAYINKGDLLICARNGSKNLVGKTAIVERNGDAYGAFMAKFVSVSSQYLYYFFSSQFFREQLDDANTTTIYQVTQSMLKRLLCPIPPAAEQVRIYDRLGLLLKTLDNSRGQ